MNIFEFRNDLIREYEDYIKSFMQIRDPRIASLVTNELNDGVFYPDPLIQLNPSFARGESIGQLIAEGKLHPECESIFRRDKKETITSGALLNLHRHQEEAIREALAGRHYVLTTGTGSGKSLAYIIPIVNHVLREGSGRGIRAIVVYPMNALANSQEGELDKYLAEGYPPGQPPVTYARYTGQDDYEKREEILRRPPDILLTNYVMLELLLTRPFEQKIIEAAQGLRFLVLDELHTYRGRQGADVALLVRRLRDRLAAREMLCVGTSATIAGGKDLVAQRREVAEVATTIFGAEVRPQSVIMETLERTTGVAGNGTGEIDALRRRVVTAGGRETFPRSYHEFIADPLVAWIESNLGLEEREGVLVRRRPTRITGPGGAAERLSQLLAIPADVCRTAIQNALLAGTECGRHPVTGAMPLTFRLHQFISRGDTVYATIEDEETRYLTLFGQHFRPGSREHILLPLVFCRECGQDYYIVRRRLGRRGEPDSFSPRLLNDQSVEEGVSEPGFLYVSATRPFPVDPAEMIAGQRLPQDWLEERSGVTRVDPERRSDLPRQVLVATDGRVGSEGLAGSYVTAPFRFCLACGVSSNRHQRDDFGKLTALGSEGRSTATTITNLTAIRRLRVERLPEKARKLLTFTDNRQDASLQAGHFNDFIETTLIRTALCQALATAAQEGIAHDELTGRVFAALDLHPELYSRQPEEKYQNRKETEIALRNLLGYRLYRDLTRGWRITLPNLEQCGLLRIGYESLDEFCADEEEWTGAHPVLSAAEPAVRRQVAQTLLDHMRRELAIDVRYLETGEQDRIRTQSFQRLIAPWAIDENERMTHASIFFPGARPAGEARDNHYLSSRSGFGQYLRRPRTFGVTDGRLPTAEIEQIIVDLLAVLTRGGLLTRVIDGGQGQPPGYQVNSAVMRWKYAGGSIAHHDPIRTPTPSVDGGRTNSYFVKFYTSNPDDLKYLEAREHTAQVPAELREQREQLFREGRLPILYCSPTMELGVDISDLNVVNLRNVPPTPANYAQRSGRAGRSGQPALVFTYCTIGSPHDQYFFKRPELMVAGQVTAPRLDLANEDLVRSHVHAIWLAETGQALQRSLVDLLEVSGEKASLALLPGLRERIDSEAVRRRAAVRARQVLATIRGQLDQAGWYSDDWLDEILRQAAERFDRTCDRWRDLYRAALNEQEIQSRVIRDASRSAEDKRQAKQTRALAEAQISLLTNVSNIAQSDFYSYRYFASEGFLPGYSFPRLPISAFIPARRDHQERNEYVSRPRFLAISEFGPRSIIYHEGAKYVINKVILPVGEEEAGQGKIKLCGACGYLHEVRPTISHDLCERCRQPLGAPLTSLFRMQNVSTRRRERITSDEEERLRYGYEIITGVRFSGSPAETPTAEVVADGARLARLTYGQAATLWRINMGWLRRTQREKLGFVLDLERGYWKNEADDPTVLNGELADDPGSGRTRRVIPYVDDRRNCLLYEPETPLSLAEMASLQAALKAAIQVCYQLEENELAVEPLPTPDDRRQILFYESAEGGAGVLHRLVREPGALAQVAQRALELCHFDAEGRDLGLAPNGRERCEAACYDCLLSYGNQREHEIVDRHAIRDLLRRLASVNLLISPVAASRDEHLADLRARAESSLEREWLGRLAAGGYRLPTAGQTMLAGAGTRPDFLYEEESVAIYIDGPDHDHAAAQLRNRRQEEALADLGYSVIRFAVGTDWESIFRRHPHVFGGTSAPASGQSAAVLSTAAGSTPEPSIPSLAKEEEFDPDLFDERFHELLRQLAEAFPGLRIEPGADVLAAGKVIGAYFAEIGLNGHCLRLIESGPSGAPRVGEALAGQVTPLVVVVDDVAEVVAQIRRICASR
ncbi:MAG: DEAD/DEAH box helicase [Acidobacteriota bacterium]